MAHILSTKQLTTLIGDLKTILDKEKYSSRFEAEQYKVQAYWAVGKRITRARIVEQASYHNPILSDLQKALKISARTLRRTVLFYNTYPKRPNVDSISWGHYRLLIGREDKKERAYYEKLILKEGWTTARLELAIKNENYHLSKHPDKKLQLKGPQNEVFLYTVALKNIVDGDTLVFDADLGFHCARTIRVRLAQIDAPEPIRKKATVKTRSSARLGDQATQFVKGQLQRAESIVLITEATGKYGRYIVHVYYQAICNKKKTAARKTDTYENGIYLNQELVDKGYARRL